MIKWFRLELKDVEPIVSADLDINKGDIIKTIERFKIKPSKLNIVCSEDIYYLKQKGLELPNVKYDVEINNYKINHYEQENIGKIFINIDNMQLESSLNIEQKTKRQNFFQLFKEIVKNIF